MTMYRTDSIKQLNYGRNMTSKQREMLDENVFCLRIPKGETIFMEKDKLRYLYFIKQGVFRFSKANEQGTQYITKLLGKGELMGRRSVITGHGAFVNAFAVTDTQVYALDKKVFLDFLNENHAFCLDVLKEFIADSKEDEDTQHLLNGNGKIINRLARLLRYLEHKFGRQGDGSLLAKLRREDMADILGTSSEYVIQLLGRLQKAGAIELKRSALWITSQKRLEGFC